MFAHLHEPLLSNINPLDRAAPSLATATPSRISLDPRGREGWPLSLPSRLQRSRSDKDYEMELPLCPPPQHHRCRPPSPCPRRRGP